eukprot:COSAG05_NODE_1576_length_4506_cov_7.927687_3_plen_190_part_00
MCVRACSSLSFSSPSHVNISFLFGHLPQHTRYGSEAILAANEQCLTRWLVDRMVRLQAEEKMIGFEVTERRLLTSAWNNAIMYDKNSKTEKNSSDWFNYIMLFMNLFIGTQAPTAHHGTTPCSPCSPFPFPLPSVFCPVCLRCRGALRGLLSVSLLVPVLCAAWLLRVRVQIIRHARTHSVCKYQSCMF